jgi:hypothetical protein
MSKSTKCHQTRARGFVRIECMIPNEQKEQFKQYCKQQGMTQARVLHKFIKDVLSTNVPE